MLMQIHLRRALERKDNNQPLCEDQRKEIFCFLSKTHSLKRTIFKKKLRIQFPVIRSGSVPKK